MPDLLTIDPKPTVSTGGFPQVDLTRVERILAICADALRALHPTQRLLVISDSGRVDFLTNTNVRLQFKNTSQRVKSLMTEIYNGTDFPLHISYDAPCTVNGATISGGVVAGGTWHLVPTEIAQLYLYVADAGSHTIQVNQDDGSGHQLITINAWTNPEEGETSANGYA